MSTVRGTNPPVQTPDIVIGFHPESPQEEAHFFIASATRASCCAPLAGFDALPDDELEKMAASCWVNLTGDNATPHLIGAIVIGWRDALRAHQQSINELNATRH